MTSILFISITLALVPTLTSILGLPMQMVKPIALLGNTLAMTGASIDNIKNRRLEWKSGLPLIVASMIMAPVGATLSQYVSIKIMSILFVLFLVFSSGMMLFYKKKESSKAKDFEGWYLTIVGVVAGTLAGLLGIGGGSIIAPLLITRGYNAKKVTALNAFVIPFSSFTGFLAYVGMGENSWEYLVGCSLAAFIGGMAGTAVMQRWINPKMVKKILAIILLIMAVKMILKFI